MSSGSSRFGPAAVILGLEGLAYAMVLPHLPVVVGARSPWWAVGALLAGYSMAQFAVLTPIAGAARRFGVPVVVGACLLGTSAGLVLTAISTNYWVLLAGRLIDGFSAGTVVVVTAAHLRRIDQSAWTTALGRLAAVRGAAIFGGILIAAAVGLATSDPETALRATAWVGAALPVFALRFAGRLGSAVDDSAPSAAPLGLATRAGLVRHVTAQAAQSGLLVISPALALVVATQTVSFLAPAVAVAGLAVGQLVVAPRLGEGVPSAAAGAAVLAVGAGTAAVAPLVGIALIGTVVGTLAPIAQSALLKARMADGVDDFDANALAGKSAIVGQILGPVTGYGALSLGPAASAWAIGLLGGSALRTAPRTGAAPEDL